MALQVWLPLTGDFHNQGLDNEMTSITGTGCSFSNDGKIGSCLKLGYTNNLTVPSLAGAKQLSIAYWCRVDTATSTNWLDPIRFYSTDGSTTQYSRQEFYTNCTQTGFWYAGGSLGGWNGVEVGVWNHYAITFNYETGVVEFYINGEKKYTQTNLNTTHYVSGINIRLGDSGLAISENDMRIYDHVLSAKEISELAKGLVLHYPLNRDGFGLDNMLIDTRRDAGASHTGYAIVDYNFSESVVNGTTYTITAHVATSSEKTYVGFYHSGGSYNMGSWQPITDNGYYKVTFTANSNMASQTRGSGHGFCRVYVSNNPSGTQGSYTMAGTAHVDWIKIEKGSVATPWVPNSADTDYSTFGLNSAVIPDTSGFGNNGTITGTLSYSGDTPRYGVSTQFDGSTNWITADSLPAETKTVSLWMKCAISGAKVAFADYNTHLAIGTYNNNSFIAYCGSGSGGTGSHVLVGNHWKDNDWNHVVIIKTGNNTCTVYLNGNVLTATDNNWWTHGSNTLLIGRRSADSYQYSGLISDFRAYATALSADDVKALYEAPISLANNGTLFANEFNET